MALIAYRATTHDYLVREDHLQNEASAEDTDERTCGHEQECTLERAQLKLVFFLLFLLHHLLDLFLRLLDTLRFRFQSEVCFSEIKIIVFPLLTTTTSHGFLSLRFEVTEIVHHVNKVLTIHGQSP